MSSPRPQPQLAKIEIRSSQFDNMEPQVAGDERTTKSKVLETGAGMTQVSPKRE